MNISNASPIQFWVNGQETFNEKVQAGVQSVPYYHKFQLSDEIKLQVNGTEGQPVLLLNVYDCDGNIVATQDFEDHDTYQDITFTFSILSLSEGYYRLQIESPFALEMGTLVIGVAMQDVPMGGDFSIDLGTVRIEVDAEEVVFELTLGHLDLQAALILEAFGAQSFKIDFDSEELTVTGSGATDASSMNYASSVSASVIKTTNSGLAQDVTIISYKKNGVEQFSDSFVGGESVVSSYNYTGLVTGDVLKVDISEG